MPDELVLRAEDVVKEHRSGQRPVPALRGVSLAVEPGRFLSIMGPSGSGKSTLLHLLGALDTPTSGEVWFEGVRLSVMRDRERTALRRHRVGFVFQEFNLVPVLTAEENVALPLVIARTSPGDRARRVSEVLDLVSIGDQRRRLPAELSGGEQQRVAIARALVTRPAVLLADEPTGNLDTATGAMILDVVRTTMRELAQTVVLVTHDARVAAAGDEIVRLRDGTIVDQRAVARRRGAASRQLEALVADDASEA